MNDSLPVRLDRFARFALLIGLIALALTALAALLSLKHFLLGYLFAFLLISGPPLGAAGLLMLHTLLGGGWGKAIRRPLEAMASTLPILPLLFVPIALGVPVLYGWADPARVAANPLLQHKAPYLQLGFWLLRSAVYFAVWGVGGWLLTDWSRRQDRDPDPRRLARLRRFSAVGLLVFFLTVTFAGIDWVASLEPRWYSTVYGLYWIIGLTLSSLALITLLLCRASESSDEITLARQDLQDIGNVLLALVVLHAYMAYSQFFISWNGNLPHEVEWYTARTFGLWRVMAVFIMFGHFLLPFALLLFRRVKRDPKALGIVVAWILFARIIDTAWMVLPATHDGVLGPVLFGTGAGVGLVGLWLSVFIWRWRRGPLALPRTAEAA